MKLCDGERILDLEIVDYQYPDLDSLENCSAYDANWLEVGIHYHDKEMDERYTDCCLLTDELAEIRDTLKYIIEGTDNSYISDFVESYLRVCIARVPDYIVFTLNFAYDVSRGWKERKITAVWTEDEANEALVNLMDMERRFPERQLDSTKGNV